MLITIALIHNNEAERLEYLVPKIKELKQEIEKHLLIEVDFYEVKTKPHIYNMCFKDTLIKEYLFWRLYRDWVTYRRYKNVPLPLDVCVFLGKMMLKAYNITKWKQNTYREAQIINEHLRAMNHALDVDSDYIIILESDAIFKENSSCRLIDLIRKIETKSERNIYVDLAGGCSKELLKVDRLQCGHHDGFLEYSKGVTNCACGILMNRRQIQTFASLLLTIPYHRYISIDWMYNLLFIEQKKRMIISLCYHTEPPIFNHGSLDGTYESNFFARGVI